MAAAGGVSGPATEPALPRTIAIVGFMGAGKSTAARSAARALGREPVDADQVIEQRLGKPIEQIFAQEGEAAFREAEERITLELLDAPPAAPGPRIVALGGGALGSDAIRRALARHLVVWIDIDVETAWRRCQGTGRPLAADRTRFAQLYAAREPVYAQAADVVVPHERSEAMAEVLAALDGLPPATRLLWATSASGDYPAYIGPGLLTRHRFWPATVKGRRFLVTDYNAGRLYGEFLDPLDGRVTIMPGEQSKTIAHAEIVWSELARGGMTRTDVVVALGGGVIGDLAGFCAATYQRGVRLVQVPTTLVAQVDSAYGGKTGVDLAEAKNYVGAYHQPRAVLADPDALASLPEAELAAGYAEVVKTALIAGGRLWELVRGGAGWDGAGWAEVVTECARTKLRIVARDERDDGIRQTLNLGHTVGHAIETVTGYASYRHGEAVALGLLAALRLSGNGDLRAEVAELLRAHGLPTELDGVDPDAVVMATARDKKRVGEGPVPFVLLPEPGDARPGSQVPARELIAAVRELAS
ncbi:MAG TPA: bifunctional shikimate kinase/3-dehydroquinate synthase [Solirubrobacteraceae bacterium]|nr:bifunctional shikimate kinase/3-dehydroquinate synthase [Solirubrobacteraceae bacterium]